MDAAPSVTSVSLTTFIIALLLLLGSLGVILFRYRKYRNVKGSYFLIRLGIFIHIIYLAVQIGLIVGITAIYSSNLVNFLILRYALILFQLWFGFTLLLEKADPSGKRLLGLIPVGSSLFPLNLTTLVLALVVGVVMFVYKSSKQRSYSPAKAVGQSVLRGQSVKSGSPPGFKKPHSPTGESASCQTAVLALHSSDIPRLKGQQDAFSRALSGKILNLQDRLLFQDIPLVVTQLEPGAQCAVTQSTHIQIKSSGEPVVLFCSQCGTMQKEFRTSCSRCGAALPLVKL